MQWLKRLLGRNTGRADPPAPPVPADSADPASPKTVPHHPPHDYQGADLQLRAGSPEFDLFIARGELDSGDNPAHGAEHLAELLRADPSRAQWLSLADRYVERWPDIDTLIHVREERYAYAEALRAYAWQRQGKLEAAARLLAEVVRITGDTRYLHAWLLPWMEAQGAIESLDEDSGRRVLASVLTNTPEAYRASLPELTHARRWAAVSERFARHAAADGALIMIRVGLLRRAARFEEALATAGALEDARSFSHAVAIGLTCRYLGRYDPADRAFRKAVELEPGNLSGYLEGGDSRLTGGQWQQARDWYEQALRVAPEDPWACASIWYCRWKLSGEQSWMDRLLEAARDDNQRARQLWFGINGRIDEPHDATANIWRQVDEKWRETGVNQSTEIGRVAVRVSALEAPSNMLVPPLDAAARGIKAWLDVSAEHIPSPDPRECAGPVDHLLWRYEGSTAQPALPAPAPQVARPIAILAQEPYEPAANWARASYVAAELGPAAVPDLLATMVHIPAMPPATHALAWVPRIQHTVAQVLAQIDTGWEGSARRSALLSVLLGPTDWTTSAAIAALAWIARREPALSQDIHRQFEILERHIPTSGYCCYAETLYEHWAELPYLFDSEREALLTKRKALED